MFNIFFLIQSRTVIENSGTEEYKNIDFFSAAVQDFNFLTLKINFFVIMQ